MCVVTNHKRWKILKVKGAMLRIMPKFLQKELPTKVGPGWMFVGQEAVILSSIGNPSNLVRHTTFS